MSELGVWVCPTLSLAAVGFSFFILSPKRGLVLITFWMAGVTFIVSDEFLRAAFCFLSAIVLPAFIIWRFHTWQATLPIGMMICATALFAAVEWLNLYDPGEGGPYPLSFGAVARSFVFDGVWLAGVIYALFLYVLGRAYFFFRGRFAGGASDRLNDGNK